MSEALDWYMENCLGSESSIVHNSQLTIEDLYSKMTRYNPLIFFQSLGSDPLIQIQRLAQQVLDSEMASNILVISLGQG